MSTSVFYLYKNTEDNVSDCPICESVFLEHDQFVYHLSSHFKKHSLPRKTFDTQVITTSQTNDIPIPCPCDAMFIEENDLKEHLILHNKELCETVKGPTESNRNNITNSENRLLHCPNCISVFNKPDELKQHILTHVGKESSLSSTVEVDNSKNALLPCPYCYHKFKEPSELKLHLTAHAENVSIYCPICDAVMIKATELKLHLMAHADKFSILGPICKAVHNESIEFKDHLLTHAEKLLPPCTLCDLKFEEPADLKAHLMAHAEKLAISCPLCDVEFVDPTELKVHLMTHDDKVSMSCSKENQVNLNNFVFDSKLISTSNISISEDAESGNNNVSSTDKSTFNPDLEKKLKCAICHRRFKRKPGLIKHMNVHFINGFRCIHCNVTYSDMELLISYYSSNNSSLEYFNCPVCDRDLLWNLDNLKLNSSIRFIETCSIDSSQKPPILRDRRVDKILHCDDKQLKCDICGDHFKIKFELIKHLFDHLQNKLSCTHCHITYQDKESLYNHTLEIHSVKSFKCPVCAKYLKDKRYFKCHVQTHSKVRPLKCTNCNKRFTDKKWLLWHMKSHSNENPYKM